MAVSSNSAFDAVAAVLTLALRLITHSAAVFNKQKFRIGRNECLNSDL